MRNIKSITRKMSSYVLHYFDIPARGEFIRLIFQHKAISFKDVRYKLAETPKLKVNDVLFPLGQVPILEVNDRVICQSHAIARYLGREFNLYGTSNDERVIIDEVLDTLKTLEEKTWIFVSRSKDAEERKQNLDDLYKNYAPRALKLIERFLQNRKHDGKFLLGNEISLADIHIMVTIETTKHKQNLEEHRNIVDGYPLIKRLDEDVRNSENIKKHLDKRGPPKYPAPPGTK